jgi:hypothetical protein
MLETEKGGKLFLANVWDEYQRAPFWRRGRVLSAYAGSMMATRQEWPESFESAKANLLPRVKERTFFGVTALQLAGADVMPFSYEILNEQLAVELVYDLPTTIASVNAERLAKWGVTLEDALRTARHNLRLRTSGTLATIRPGLYRSPWCDNHDSSRLLLTELITRLEVRGAPVAMLPSRDILLVTGSDDADGLAAMAAIAEPALREPRTVSGTAFVFEKGAWSAFVPPIGHPQRDRFRLMAHMSLAQDYEQQKHWLDRKHQAEGADVFVGSVLILRNKTSGRVTSLSTWAFDAVTLLPRTDELAIATGAGDAPSLQVPWDLAASVLGELLEPQGLVPERYRVARSPSAEQLARLRAQAEAPRG